MTPVPICVSLFFLYFLQPSPLSPSLCRHVCARPYMFIREKNLNFPECDPGACDLSSGFEMASLFNGSSLENDIRVVYGKSW